METNATRKCETCVFYAPRRRYVPSLSEPVMATEETGHGDCKRYPPSRKNRFPTVADDSWCGEHRTQQEDRAPKKSGWGPLGPVFK